MRSTAKYFSLPLGKFTSRKERTWSPGAKDGQAFLVGADRIGRRIFKTLVNPLGGSRKDGATLVCVIADCQHVIKMLVEKFIQMGQFAVARVVDARVLSRADSTGSNQAVNTRVGGSYRRETQLCFRDEARRGCGASSVLVDVSGGVGGDAE
jgi:hypothetical protein